MKSELNKSKISPHFWWTFSVLGILVIGLVAYILTYRVMCADILMEYISFASVILSITLSIFAILYTYTSNIEIQRQFDKINSASDRITSTSKELDANLKIILNHLEKIDNNQQDLKETIVNTQKAPAGIENMKNHLQQNPN
jgi:glucan phosphoethanolaminetransferase (alkaline phosphatase superfamily)